MGILDTEKNFEIDGREYKLKRPPVAGERRIKADYAAMLGPGGPFGTADILDALHGQSMEAEAYFRECLKVAPPHWYDKDGKLSFEEVYPEEFEAVWEKAGDFLKGAAFRNRAKAGGAPTGDPGPGVQGR